MEFNWERCSKSNASCFIMLACNIRGKWWYGSRRWTFSPIFQYILFHCDRWQQRGSLTKRHLTWKHIWNRSVSLNSFMWKKWHPLTFIDVCLAFMETHSECEHTEVVGGAFQRWWQWQWVFSTGADFYECYMLLFISGENAQLMVLTVLKNNVL